MGLHWEVRAFCDCGWSYEPPFGDRWVAQQHHPCCPDCGASSYGYEMRTVAADRRSVGPKRWWGQPTETVWLERIGDGEIVELAFDGKKTLQIPRPKEAG